MADDDEEVRCRVSYIADDMGPEDETNWIKRAGTAKVTYPNGHTFEGNFRQFTVSLLMARLSRSSNV